MHELFEIIKTILEDPAIKREFKEWEESNEPVNADPGN